MVTLLLPGGHGKQHVHVASFGVVLAPCGFYKFYKSVAITQTITTHRFNRPYASPSVIACRCQSMHVLLAHRDASNKGWRRRYRRDHGCITSYPYQLKYECSSPSLSGLDNVE